MHSPFRSESDVFRAAVAVLLGAAVAVAIGAVTDAAIGAIAAAVLAGLAIGLVVAAGRGSITESIDPPAASDGVHRVLVVASQTVGGKELVEQIRVRARDHSPLELLVLSPALTRSRLELLASDTDGARMEAEERLRSSLDVLAGLRIEAQGMVGDEDPIIAVADALGDFAADEVIVSTHPPEQSRWLERDVVERLGRLLSVPVAHVVVRGAAAGESAAA